MTNNLVSALVVAIVTCSAAARAGECAIRVDRTSIAGKEAEAYGPYGMRNPTSSVKPADSLAACKALAIVDCTIKRKDILKAKKVDAMFDREPISGGADLCK